jgi:hypothetical protein
MIIHFENFNLDLKIIMLKLKKINKIMKKFKHLIL